jgi:tetratricopeptide (TPR) repeat protein
MDRVLALSNDPLLRSQRITLTPTDGFVLSRIDGTVSAHDVIGLSPVSPEETERSLFGLLCTGIVDYQEKEPTSRTRPNLLPNALRGKEDESGTGPHTRPEPRPAVAAPREAPSMTEPRPREASTPPPEAPVSSEPAPEARGSDPAGTIREAEGLFARGRYADVVRVVEPLLPQVDGPLKTRAAILLARGCMKSGTQDDQAERVLLELVDEDPRCTPAYLFLGALYRSQKRVDDARGMYQKVLEREPRHRAAAAELAALGDEPAD